MRSALFAPGYRDDFLEKLSRTRADGVIVDLEDSVPKARREEARQKVAVWIGRAAYPRQVVCVRLNSLEEDCLVEDLAAAVAPSLAVVLVPKVSQPEDVLRVASALEEQERRKGLAISRVRIWPLLESALAVRNAFEIATCSPRIAYMGLGASPGGDLARDLGVQHTGTSQEILHVMSKVLLDVRAAKVFNPIGGLSQIVGNPGEIEQHARFVRSLGYEGMMAIHPSQVPVINAVFGPTASEIAAARELVDVFEAAQREGKGAVTHRGKFVDAAHYHSARALLRRASNFAE